MKTIAPAREMTQEPTNPQTSKVEPKARAAGQTVGRGMVLGGGECQSAAGAISGA